MVLYWKKLSFFYFCDIYNDFILANHTSFEKASVWQLKAKTCPQLNILSSIQMIMCLMLALVKSPEALGGVFLRKRGEGGGNGLEQGMTMDQAVVQRCCSVGYSHSKIYGVWEMFVVKMHHCAELEAITARVLQGAEENTPTWTDKAFQTVSEYRFLFLQSNVYSCICLS